MITLEQSMQMALEEEKGLVITNAVKYGDYYVFFMQPKGVDPQSEDALLDSYVFVNFKTGDVEYNSILMFDDFMERAEEISLPQ